MKRWIITPNGRSNLIRIKKHQENSLLEEIKRNTKLEQRDWDIGHASKKYQNVFSITDDPQICTALTRGINKHVKRVLIPGCGSKTNLQKYIVQNFPNVETIYCTDWSKPAIDQASNNFPHEKIRYQCEDTSALSFKDNTFDYVIISNSILSNLDLQNRKMIEQCHRVLKKGGFLYGMFPTILCAIEFAYLDPHYAHWATGGIIDLTKNMFYEESQNLGQIFYSPIRLNQIFHEAGFVRKGFEVYFFDNQYFKRESKRIYGLHPDSGLCVGILCHTRKIKLMIGHSASSELMDKKTNKKTRQNADCVSTTLPASTLHFRNRVFSKSGNSFCNLG